MQTTTDVCRDILDKVDDCLAVPLQAVHEKEGKRFCIVKKGAVTENVEVTIGASNDTMVEIKSGLTEGAEVLLTK